MAAGLLLWKEGRLVRMSIPHSMPWIIYKNGASKGTRLLKGKMQQSKYHIGKIMYLFAYKPSSPSPPLPSSSSSYPCLHPSPTHLQPTATSQPPVTPSLIESIADRFTSFVKGNAHQIIVIYSFFSNLFLSFILSFFLVDAISFPADKTLGSCSHWMLVSYHPSSSNSS